MTDTFMRDVAGNVLGGWIPETNAVEMPRLERVATVNTPTRVDLRPHCSPVENQGHIGSCVANAIAGAIEFHLIRNGTPKDLSRLFIYYNARRLAETETVDRGSSRTKALAAVLGWGACSEAMWPYQPAMVHTRPTKDCYEAASALTAVQCAITPHGQGVREALAYGFPVVFGMQTPRQMIYVEAHKTKQMRPPADGKWETTSSGHAMLIVGYDDFENAWLVRNSWGPGWADGGYVWIDYDVMHHYATQGNEHPCVIGQIDDSRAFRLAGPSQQSMLSDMMATASQTARSEISNVRRNVSADLDSSLDKARADIRSRLRGPGAGGGY